MSVRLNPPRIHRRTRIPAALLVSVLTACAPASVAPSEAPSAEESVAETPSVAPLASPTDDPSSGEAFEVMVNGLRIVGHCSGSRTGNLPVVVLQSGNGGSDRHLAGIEQHLAERTMVCAWSRPGAGDSDAPLEEPRPVSEVVAEMHDVLGAIEVEPPYFPIGTSGGAVVVFMFAQAYSDEVAGFVVMNPNPPYTEWVATATEIGLPDRLLGDADADYRGLNPEGIDFTGNDRMATDPLPETMPYAVMYDEECGQADCTEFLAWEAALQEGLAGVGGGGRFVWAHGAGHEIAATQPEVVHGTIDEVWAEATD